MKKSIFQNWQVVYWVDYSNKWAEVVDITEAQFLEETKPIVEPIPEPTQEELEEMKLKQKEQQRETEIQEIEKMILRKQALEFLEEDTEEINVKLEAKTAIVKDIKEEVIWLKKK